MLGIFYVYDEVVFKYEYFYYFLPNIYAYVDF